MITQDTIRDTLHDWIDANTTGLNAIVRLEQNNPRPALPYVGYRISGLDKIGHDYVERPEDLQEARVSGNREFTVEIQHFGSGAIDRLEGLRSSLEMPAQRVLFDAQGIAFVDDLGITDISQLLDTRYEERALLELRFRVGTDYTTITGQIDTVKIDKTFKDAEGTTVYTEPDYTIPKP